LGLDRSLIFGAWIMVDVLVEAGPLIDRPNHGLLLTMLSDSMLPEAHENGGNAVGLLTVLGFTVAFALSQLT
jgi:hypothetical protein